MFLKLKYEINILNSVQIQKQFTDCDQLMHEKELLVKRKLERLKFTNEKQNVD